MPNHYYPGQRIRCRGEEWQITEAKYHQVVGGEPVWEVYGIGLTGIVRNQEFCFMSDLDELIPVDPTDIEPVSDNSPKGAKTRLYLEAHLRRLAPRNGALYLGQHGAVQTLKYQLEPASKALHMLRPRILIADAVGLGKTIECGILLSELIRRGKGTRVLAAVPKATLEQFQLEMWGRFSIPFHRLDSQGLEQLRQDLPSTMNPFYHFSKTLISIDTLKLKKHRTLLEECAWDVLIIDECHNVADRAQGSGESLRHKVARRLADRAKAVILMSATPHDGTRQGFASLIKLLDRTAIRSDENYTADDIRKYFIRRTRAQVHGEIENRAPRAQTVHRIPLEEKEINVLQMLHDIQFVSKSLKSRNQAGVRELFKTTLIKSFLSSPAALYETAGKKLKSLKSSKDRNAAEIEQDCENLRNIIHEVEHANLLSLNSRLKYLNKYIKENPLNAKSKLVIFTERLATLRSIQDYLIREGLVDSAFDPKVEDEKQPKKGKLVAVADGSLPEHLLTRVVRAFQSNKHPVEILVATNVASEGLNLHETCHRLIHFDLPWSFITLEQRNGRIDRLGQTRQPQIHYFASVAERPTRESNLEALKDDFWIVAKIEYKSQIAGEDLDEEALRRGFVSSEDEANAYTEQYESGASNQTEPKPDSDILAILMGHQPSGADGGGAYTKKLPTLFDRSPNEFVESAANICALEARQHDENSISLPISKEIKAELANWPRELRPPLEHIELDSHPTRMEAHYKQVRNADAKLSKTFMNEIHPAIQLLEQSAMNLFPGPKMPVLKVQGLQPGSTFFLLQGSLFNKMNEYVFQSWQVVEFEPGKNVCSQYVNMHEPDHTHAVAELVRDLIDNAVTTPALTDFERKSIQKKAADAIKWMRELISKARDERAKELKPILREELKRIREWESSRTDYLRNVVNATSQVDNVHGGTFAIKKKAEAELSGINSFSKEYEEFIQNHLMTQAEPDLRILAAFVAAES